MPQNDPVRRLLYALGETAGQIPGILQTQADYKNRNAIAEYDMGMQQQDREAQLAVQNFIQRMDMERLGLERDKLAHEMSKQPPDKPLSGEPGMLDYLAKTFGEDYARRYVEALIANKMPRPEKAVGAKPSALEELADETYKKRLGQTKDVPTGEKTSWGEPIMRKMPFGVNEAMAARDSVLNSSQIYTPISTPMQSGEFDRPTNLLGGGAGQPTQAPAPQQGVSLDQLDALIMQLEQQLKNGQ